MLLRIANNTTNDTNGHANNPYEIRSTGLFTLYS